MAHKILGNAAVNPEPFEAEPVAEGKSSLPSSEADRSEVQEAASDAVPEDFQVGFHSVPCESGSLYCPVMLGSYKCAISLKALVFPSL